MFRKSSLFKFYDGKIITLLLSTIILASGISAGVILTKQNQNPVEKAAGTECGSSCVAAGGTNCSCPGGWSCQNGFCIKQPEGGCTSNNQCGPGEECRGGVCKPKLVGPTASPVPTPWCNPATTYQCKYGCVKTPQGGYCFVTPTPSPTPTPVNCGGKAVGTRECNSSGGYNYCQSDGKWYSSSCPANSTCTGGICVTPKPTPVPTPYCHLTVASSCQFGACIKTLDGGYCPTPKPTPVNCGGKAVGTRECNASGGYNMCQSDGRWYSSSCPVNTTCSAGACKPNPTPYCPIGCAFGCVKDLTGGYCIVPTKAPTPTPAPTPFCNTVVKLECGLNCIKDLRGGSCPTPVPTPVNCGGKAVGTKECNASGGYNYCQNDGKWYSSSCPVNTTCSAGECKPNPTPSCVRTCPDECIADLNGGHCVIRTQAPLPTGTPRPTNTPTPEPCSTLAKLKCFVNLKNCIPDSSGGHCSDSIINPISPDYCSTANQIKCGSGCVSDKDGGHCPIAPHVDSMLIPESGVPTSTLPNAPGQTAPVNNLTTNFCQMGCSATEITLNGQTAGRIGYQYTNGDIAGFYIAPNGKYYPIAQSAGGPTASDLSFLALKIASTTPSTTNPNSANKLTPLTNADCGQFLVAAGTACRNPVSGKLVDYNYIVYSNILSSDQYSRGTSISNIPNPSQEIIGAAKVCKASGRTCSTYGDLVDFALTQLKSQTQDPYLVVQVQNANYTKAIKGDPLALALLDQINPTLHSQAVIAMNTETVSPIGVPPTSGSTNIGQSTTIGSSSKNQQKATPTLFENFNSWLVNTINTILPADRLAGLGSPSSLSETGVVPVPVSAVTSGQGFIDYESAVLKGGASGAAVAAVIVAPHALPLFAEAITNTTTISLLSSPVVTVGSTLLSAGYVGTTLVGAWSCGSDSLSSRRLEPGFTTSEYCQAAGQNFGAGMLLDPAGTTQLFSDVFNKVFGTVQTGAFLVKNLRPIQNVVEEAPALNARQTIDLVWDDATQTFVMAGYSAPVTQTTAVSVPQVFTTSEYTVAPTILGSTPLLNSTQNAIIPLGAANVAAAFTPTLDTGVVLSGANAVLTQPPQTLWQKTVGLAQTLGSRLASIPETGGGIKIEVPPLNNSEPQYISNVRVEENAFLPPGQRISVTIDLPQGTETYLPATMNDAEALISSRVDQEVVIDPKTLGVIPAKTISTTSPAQPGILDRVANWLQVGPAPTFEQPTWEQAIQTVKDRLAQPQPEVPTISYTPVKLEPAVPAKPGEVPQNTTIYTIPSQPGVTIKVNPKTNTVTIEKTISVVDLTVGGNSVPVSTDVGVTGFEEIKINGDTYSVTGVNPALDPPIQLSQVTTDGVTQSPIKDQDHSIPFGITPVTNKFLGITLPAQSVSTEIGSIPIKGIIDISFLHPHEPGYNPLTVEGLTDLLAQGAVLDPIKITVYNGQIFTYDGANRVIAVSESGQNVINYEFTQFDKLDSTTQKLVSDASTGTLLGSIKIPSSYNSDEFGVSPFQSAESKIRPLDQTRSTNLLKEYLNNGLQAAGNTVQDISVTLKTAVPRLVSDLQINLENTFGKYLTFIRPKTPLFVRDLSTQYIYNFNADNSVKVWNDYIDGILYISNSSANNRVYAGNIPVLSVGEDKFIEIPKGSNIILNGTTVKLSIGKPGELLVKIIPPDKNLFSSAQNWINSLLKPAITQPPIVPGEIFDPTIEVRYILKQPTALRSSSLAEFKSKSIYQQNGLQILQDILENNIRSNPNVTIDFLKKIVDDNAATFGFPNWMVEHYKKAINIYSDRRQIVNDILTAHPDSKDLYLAIFGRLPVGEIKVIDGGYYIALAMEDTTDLGYAYLFDYTEGGISKTEEQVSQTGKSLEGFLKSRPTLIPGTNNILIALRGTSNFDTSLIHEAEHAFNSLLQESGIPYIQNESSGNIDLSVSGSKKTNEELLRRFALDYKEHARNGYGFGDEILAYLKQNDLSNSEIYQILTTPSINNGLYDYNSEDKAYLFDKFTWLGFDAKTVDSILNEVFNNAEIQKGLDAFDTLLGKRYSRDDTIKILQKYPLSQWPKVAQRANRYIPIIPVVSNDSLLVQWLQSNTNMFQNALVTLKVSVPRMFADAGITLSNLASTIFLQQGSATVGTATENIINILTPNSTLQITAPSTIILKPKQTLEVSMPIITSGDITELNNALVQLYGGDSKAGGKWGSVLLSGNTATKIFIQPDLLINAYEFEFMRRFGGTGGLPKFLGAVPNGYQMERINGTSLTDLVNQEFYKDPDKILNITEHWHRILTNSQAQELLDKIAEFHKATGRVHGDLGYWDDILIENSGHIRITDPEWERIGDQTPRSELKSVFIFLRDTAGFKGLQLPQTITDTEAINNLVAFQKDVQDMLIFDPATGKVIGFKDQKYRVDVNNAGEIILTPTPIVKIKIRDIVASADSVLDSISGPRQVGCRGAACEFSSDLVKVDAELAGDKAVNYHTADINSAVGIPSIDGIYHQFTIITDPAGKQYLVDLTLSQFTTIDQNNPVAIKLIKDGYIELTDSSFNEYLTLLTPGTHGAASLDILKQVPERQISLLTTEEIKLYQDALKHPDEPNRLSEFIITYTNNHPEIKNGVYQPVNNNDNSGTINPSTATLQSAPQKVNMWIQDNILNGPVGNILFGNPIPTTLDSLPSRTYSLDEVFKDTQITQDGLIITKHNIAPPTTDPYWNRFEKFGYSVYTPGTPLSHEQVLAKIKNPKTKIILIDTGLVSSTEELGHQGTSFIHALIKASPQPEDLLIIAISEPGFDKSALYSYEVNSQNLSDRASAEFIDRFSQLMGGLPEDRTVIIGHSLAGERVIFLKNFPNVISVSPALNPNRDIAMLALTGLNNLGGYLIVKTPFLKPLVDSITYTLTRIALGDSSGLALPQQVRTHLLEYLHNPLPTELLAKQLVTPNQDLPLGAYLPANIHFLVGSRDLLTNKNSTIDWLIRHFRNRDLSESLVGNLVTQLPGAGHTSVFTDTETGKAVADKAIEMLYPKSGSIETTTAKPIEVEQKSSNQVSVFQNISTVLGNISNNIGGNALQLLNGGRKFVANFANSLLGRVSIPRKATILITTGTVIVTQLFNAVVPLDVTNYMTATLNQPAVVYTIDKTANGLLNEISLPGVGQIDVTTAVDAVSLPVAPALPEVNPISGAFRSVTDAAKLIATNTSTIIPQGLLPTQPTKNIKLEAAYADATTGINLSLPENLTPKSDLVTTFLTNKVNDYNLHHPFEPGQEISPQMRQEFADYIRKALAASPYADILSTNTKYGSKVTSVDTALDVITQQYGLHFTTTNPPVDEMQRVQCVGWVSLVQSTRPDLNLANIQGLSLSDASGVYWYANNPDQNIGGGHFNQALYGGDMKQYVGKHPDEKFMFYISGETVAWHYNNLHDIPKGSIYVYGNHMGAVLDVYKNPEGNYYYLITESNSPAGPLDGTPRTFLVDEKGFSDIVGVNNTIFLLPKSRMNEAANPSPLAPELQNAITKGTVSKIPSDNSTNLDIASVRTTQFKSNIPNPQFSSPGLQNPYTQIPDWFYSKILPKLNSLCTTNSDCIDKFNALPMADGNGDFQLMLDKNFIPEDLVNLSSLNVPVYTDGVQTTRAAAPYVYSFIDDLKAAGIKSMISEGYRSYSDQTIENYNDPNAAALPGMSMHQAGVAFDVFRTYNNGQINFNKTLSKSQEVLNIAHKNGIVHPFSWENDAPHWVVLDAFYPGLTEILIESGINPDDKTVLKQVFLGMAQTYEYLSQKYK